MLPAIIWHFFSVVLTTYLVSMFNFTTKEYDEPPTLMDRVMGTVMLLALIGMYRTLYHLLHFYAIMSQGAIPKEILNSKNRLSCHFHFSTVLVFLDSFMFAI